jgi:hypothetical protein
VTNWSSVFSQILAELTRKFTVSVSEQLLAALTDAYREAVGGTTARTCDTATEACCHKSTWINQFWK